MYINDKNIQTIIFIITTIKVLFVKKLTADTLKLKLYEYPKEKKKINTTNNNITLVTIIFKINNVNIFLGLFKYIFIPCI